MAEAAPGGVSDGATSKRSSFHTALRILPAVQREAMYAIYGFCRAVDDIADGDGPRDRRRAQLEDWTGAIDRLFAGRIEPDTRRLAGPVTRFGLKREDFHAVIDGMAMDVAGDIQAPDWTTLDLYCDRVASAVGRLSVRVFGMPEQDGIALSHHLGRALQLTNILRDIDEDAEIDRLYLPREALQAAGIGEVVPRVVAADPRLDVACRPVAARAEAHFREAWAIMDRSPRAAVRAPRLMAVAYGGILRRLAASGWNAPRNRISASKPELMLAVLRYGLF